MGMITNTEMVDNIRKLAPTIQSWKSLPFIAERIGFDFSISKSSHLCNMLRSQCWESKDVPNHRTGKTMKVWKPTRWSV